MTKRTATVYLSIVIGVSIFVLAYYIASIQNDQSAASGFDGERAYSDVQKQVAFGPRTPGSAGHTQIRKWIKSELESTGWIVTNQDATRMGHSIFNIIARRGNGNPEIILGAHYDTRLIADHDLDPNKRGEPVPGANDGASGVAILLELARSLPAAGVPVWLVFFDAEDNGRIEGWDWILGSRIFVEELSATPRAVIIVDMVGDENLDIYYEKNSNVKIRSEIWDMAAILGYEEEFIPQEKHSMLDDHTPFLEAGIPAVDIIDFDYKYWHTTEDTADKVSAESLQTVGDTLWHWLTLQSR